MSFFAFSVENVFDGAGADDALLDGAVGACLGGGVAAAGADGTAASGGAATGAGAGGAVGAGGFDPPMLRLMVGGGGGATVCSGRSKGGGGGTAGAEGATKPLPGINSKAPGLSLPDMMVDGEVGVTVEDFLARQGACGCCRSKTAQTTD